MLTRYYSFKSIIAVLAIVMALLAYGLSIYSTHVYRNLAVENQTRSLQKLIGLEVENLVQLLSHEQHELARTLMKSDRFESAFVAEDIETLRLWLSSQLLTSFLKESDLRLNTLIIRRENGDVMLQVSDEELFSYTGCPVAQSELISLNQQNEKTISLLCSQEEHLFSEVLVPIEYGASLGYMHLVAYANDRLKLLEAALNQPIQIIDSQNQQQFKSENWVESSDEYLYPLLEIVGDDSVVGASVVSSAEVQPFIESFEQTEQRLLLIVTAFTLGALALILLFCNRIFHPLAEMRNSVGALLTGRYGHIANTKLPAELNDLVVAYNEMVDGLEEETISRRQMEEKLRSEKDFIVTILDSITNPVVVVDSKKRIRLLNPGAERLFGEKLSDLRDSPIDEIMILYENKQMTRIVDIESLLRKYSAINTLFFYDTQKNIIELEFSASPMIDMEAEDVGFVIILKDVSEYRQLRRKLSYEGSHDQLTGFFNRTAFEQKFENLVIEEHDSVPQHVLAYLDLDQFHIINETCGSAAGDVLLKQVGEIIQKHVRKSDVLSRLSGDEYGIIMPFFEMGRALQVMQNIIIQVQQNGFEWNEKEYHVTASIGVMAFGEVSDDYSDRMSRVTTACFLAKKNGGNQFHFIDENDQKVTAQRESMDWVSGIMKGFTEDRFRLYVQPIAPIDDNEKTSHYEVLIRYRAQDGTIISPGDFLPPAERYNLIEKIDCWVVNKIIECLQLHAKELGDVMFSVNLSGRSIGSKNFQKFLHDSLSASDIDMNSLCFEITETAVVDDVERSVEFINSIKKLGVKFSLDDFGTGLSSFSYLKQFPVDYLKIDGEFVRDIARDSTSYVFVRSMTEVGHCLDMKVIAEFVESDTMFSKLREANVDYVQGYIIGKPVEIESLCKPVLKG